MSILFYCVILVVMSTSQILFVSAGGGGGGGGEKDDKNKQQNLFPTLRPTVSVKPSSMAPTFEYAISFDGTVETKVYPEDGTTLDYYGTSLAIHHHTAVVGAYANTDMGEDAGAVYVYQTNATYFPEYSDGSTPWYFYQKLVADPITTTTCNNKGKCTSVVVEAANGEFGYAVGIWNDTMVVGAHRQQDKHADGESVSPPPSFPPALPACLAPALLFLVSTPRPALLSNLLICQLF